MSGPGIAPNKVPVEEEPEKKKTYDVLGNLSPSTFLAVVIVLLACFVGWILVTDGADGILYTSFKYGNAEEVRKKRLFSDFTESSFQVVLETVLNLKMFKNWKTVDARPDRKDEFWLNMLLQKT